MRQNGSIIGFCLYSKPCTFCKALAGNNVQGFYYGLSNEAGKLAKGMLFIHVPSAFFFVLYENYPFTPVTKGNRPIFSNA
jgi:hypothetical protein